MWMELHRTARERHLPPPRCLGSVSVHWNLLKRFLSLDWMVSKLKRVHRPRWNPKYDHCRTASETRQSVAVGVEAEEVQASAAELAKLEVYPPPGHCHLTMLRIVYLLTR